MYVLRIYENIHKCTHNAHGFSKHRRSHCSWISSHRSLYPSGWIPRLWAAVGWPVLYHRGAQWTHVRINWGSFSKTLTPEPHPQMSQQLWAGCFNFNILEKKKKIPAWVYCATKAEIPYSRQSWEGLAPGWCGIWSSVGSELASFFRTSDSQASQLSGTLDPSLLPFFPMWKQGPWPRAQGRWGVAVKRAIPRPSKILPLREAWWVQTQVTLPAHRSLWTTTMKLRRKTRLSPVEEQNFCRLEQKLLRKHTFL